MLTMIDRKLVVRALKFHLICLDRVSKGHAIFSYEEWVNLHAQYGVYDIYSALSKERRNVKEQIALIEENLPLQLTLFLPNEAPF